MCVERFALHFLRGINVRIPPKALKAAFGWCVCFRAHSLMCHSSAIQLPSTRLETRTKESNTCASVWAYAYLRIESDCWDRLHQQPTN
mmetsp:Transcript_29107/g.83559  ORF Transcript_29107/g.83559 Transcript_29107/m.83559 type:complete len:88 (+) Transcript_29107:678-941(+)